MNSYDSKQVDIQLYQITPSSDVLSCDAKTTTEAIMPLDVVENDGELKTKLKSVATLGELLLSVRHNNRLCTRVFNHFLAHSAVGNDLGWDDERRGIRLSDERVIKGGEFRSIQTCVMAELRADRWVGDTLFFTVMIKNPVYFSENLKAESFVNFLTTLPGDKYLPAYDRKKSFNNIVRSSAERPVYDYEKKTRGNRNQKAVRIGERFVQAGRMTPEEYQLLSQSKAAFPMCYATSYSDKTKRYAYPARDIEFIASDALVGLKNKYPAREFPAELDEAIHLYQFAKSEIRELMDAKHALIEHLEKVLVGHFEMVSPAKATCNFLKTPRYKLKGRTKINQAVKDGSVFYRDVELEMGINALCYPFAESTPERKEKFLKFFGKTSKVGRDMNILFSKIDYSAVSAVQDPIAVADRIVNETQCNAALLVWPNWSKLPNNKPLEFELMRRGVATQNVIDVNFKANAPKISALIKGMVEKFPISEKNEIGADADIGRFDYIFGLDISRHGNLDIASFPIVIDKTGKVYCKLSDTPYTKDKEKRSSKEISRVISQVVGNAHMVQEHVNILFLRDGVAYEDYDEVAACLPDNVSLTVISVRKNLLNTVAEEMPKDCFYSIYADHDDGRFLFGVNARQGEGAMVTRLHLAELVRNPCCVSQQEIGDILIALACNNKTTEMEIGSLPFPIAYADRMAWTIRDMVQDRGLLNHVIKNYAAEVDAEGGATMFIYKVIKDFVENRPNGFSFAI